MSGLGLSGLLNRQMMRNCIKNLFIVLFAVVSLTGCIKEIYPANGTLTDEQMKDYPVSMLLDGLSVDMMAAETAGYYSAYGDQTDFGLPAIHLRTEYMLEDLVSVGNVNYNQFNTYVASLYMNSDYQYCGYFWDCYYSWIKGANEIIGMIDPETESAEEKDWLGQAYAYRAMFYLDLARLYLPKENTNITSYQVYGDAKGLTVPKVTEKTTEEDALHNPRLPWEEMFGFILEDLAAAEKYLEGSAATSYLRPTLAAVYGLYARTYLELGANESELNYDEQESSRIMAEIDESCEQILAAAPSGSRTSNPASATGWRWNSRRRARDMCCRCSRAKTAWCVRRWQTLISWCWWFPSPTLLPTLLSWTS